MRVASLLPAATEWLAAFGGTDDLVARSHACDYPPEVNALPVVTSAAVITDDARMVDEEVREAVREGLSPFDVDLDRLVDLAPDVVLTQTQCRVCAVSEEQLSQAVARALGPEVEIFSLHAYRFGEVLKSALALGRVVGRSSAAMQVVAEGERRLRRLRDRLGLQRTTSLAEAPTVAVIEWLEPAMTAGHWTPDLVELAGARSVCARPGERSVQLNWEEMVQEDPYVLVLSPCGVGQEAAMDDLHYLTERPQWGRLRAVRDGRVFLVDGNAFFNRPGPRLYRSIELLAAAVHGDRAEIGVASDEMVRLD
ncbi:MAG: ABC transporter substrate-binding protein [Rhodothermales bacterium]